MMKYDIIQMRKLRNWGSRCLKKSHEITIKYERSSAVERNTNIFKMRAHDLDIKLVYNQNKGC